MKRVPIFESFRIMVLDSKSAVVKASAKADQQMRRHERRWFRQSFSKLVRTLANSNRLALCCSASIWLRDSWRSWF